MTTKAKKRNDELVIDPEFAAFLSPQTAEEIAGLEENLFANGCLDPIKAHTETGIVLDGHTRLKLCEKHAIPYRVEWVSVPGGREAALDWIIAFQIDRRNLTVEQKSYLRGKEYLAKKRLVGRPSSPEPSSNGEDHEKEEATGSTVDKLAEKHRVVPSTISRDAEYAKAVDAMPKKDRIAVLTGVGPTRQQVVAAAKASAPPRAKRVKKKKPGQAKFPWPEHEKVYGRLVRATDEIAKAYDSAKSNEHRSALRLLGEYMEKIQEWRQRLEAKLAGKE